MRQTTTAPPADEKLPTFEEALASDIDLWAEAALRQPDGPSYEFIAPLLPPLRYVDAPFRHYPIALGAPGGPVKSRLVSNGSAINALARQPNWRTEEGIPVTVRVGRSLKVFGENLHRLDGPRYEAGYIPIVQLTYRHEEDTAGGGNATYTQEVFAAVDPVQAQHGLLLARYGASEGGGKVELQFEGSELFSAPNRVLRNPRGEVLAVFDERWQWNVARSALVANLQPGEHASVGIFTRPFVQPLLARMNDDVYAQHRQKCIDCWNELLSRGMQVHVDEPIVNQAWRAFLMGCFIMLNGDEIRYSSGNQYAKVYIGEGGDAARAFMLWGHLGDAARMTVPLFTFTRGGLEFHQAAFKLQMLAHYYLLTRDAEFIRRQKHLWQKEIDVILNGREEETGMLPREKYCGDLEERIYSLNSNGNCWRALRDWSIVLEEIGDAEQARRLDAVQKEYRRTILDALNKNIRRDSDPPFVPMALSGEEEPPPHVTATRLGAYWGLMIVYVLGSGVFPADSEPADAVIQFLQKRRGLFLGLTSVREGESFWVGGRRINDLYGMRYVLTLLRRDEVERALVSFYAKIAHAATRDTFIGAEGATLCPVDEHGRQMYLPPNSAGNANFLQQLRHLLVQDWDMDDDGRPDTLRLLFATPRRWLTDGKTIRVERAPTAFGELSITATSRVSEGSVDVEIALPPRPAKKVLLRLRLPKGWAITGATAGGAAIKMIDDDTLDLTGHKGRINLSAKVRKG